MAEPLPSGIIADDEPLARFIFRSRDIRDNSIRDEAFLPDKSGETSVFRHQGLTQPALWSIGDRIAAGRPSPPNVLRGRADFLAHDVREAGRREGSGGGLDLRPDENPPNEPNHAVIFNWPPAKEDRRLLAKELAERAAWIPRP
ncbi:MAG: hypothetical protein HY719_10140 [Planctomycetes bacterium]|nr:hypothetical protein [Planctomycetota bacterium]